MVTDCARWEVLDGAEGWAAYAEYIHLRGCPAAVRGFGNLACMTEIAKVLRAKGLKDVICGVGCLQVDVI